MSRFLPYMALAVALVFTSWASIIIRLTPASGVVIAFWRQLLATLGTLLIVWYMGQAKELRDVLKSDNNMLLLALAGSGFCLALHFATWISSLFYTSVAQSLVIVDSSPLFVVMGGYLFLKESINRYQTTGVAVSVVGGVVIAVAGLEPSALGSNPLLGNVLAFVGAITVAGYLLVGRFVRQINQMGVFVYTAWVYGFSTFFLFIIAFLIDPAGMWQSLTLTLPTEAYVLFGLLALLSTMLGHTLYNFSLQEVKAAIVSIVTLGEPIVSSVLAVFILEEFPTTLTIVGGLLVLLGVMIAVWKEEEESVVLGAGEVPLQAKEFGGI